MRLTLLIAATLAVAGAVLFAIGQDVAGLSCLLLAGISGTEAAFFAVGRSEDRDRRGGPHPYV